MNRRGFLFTSAAAMIAPILPVSTTTKVVGKWASISVSQLDPDAPVTSSLMKELSYTPIPSIKPIGSYNPKQPHATERQS